MHKEIKLANARFYIPKRRLITQSILSAILMSLPIGSFFLDIDRQLRWFTLGLSSVFVLFLFLFAGFSSEPGDEPMDACKFYGRGTLIFLGIFWTALIVGVGVAMYIQFPRP